jgi:hypothetical protein
MATIGKISGGRWEKRMAIDGEFVNATNGRLWR